jgi:hypothetical protein
VTLLHLKALRQMQQLTEQAKAQEKLQQDQLELIKKHKVWYQCSLLFVAYGVSRCFPLSANIAPSSTSINASLEHFTCV